MTSFIGNLKLTHKFVLIGAVAALMIAVPSALIVSTDLARLRFAQAELSGLEPAHDALQLLRQTQQHRGLSAGLLGGDPALAAARQAKQVEVERALAEATISVARLGDPKLIALAARIGAEWQAVAAGVGGQTVSAAQSFGRHTALIGAQLSLIDDIGNVSGIVLHPEPAGYFLQLGVLTHLPKLTESLGQMRARGAVLLARGEAAPQDRVHLEWLATAALAHRQDAGKALDLALQGDPRLRRAIAAPLQAAIATADAGLALVDEKIVRAQTLNHPPAEYFAATTRVIDAQFTLIEAAFQSLGTLLQDDLAAAQRALALVLGSIVLLSALALWIMASVTRTTTASVVAALHLAKAVAGGDLRSTVPATGRDEVAQLLRALDLMKEGLARVVSGVRSNAEGVAAASAQIAQGNNELSSRTEEQASALEQTAASMQQISSTVMQNADNARQANQLALRATSVAVEGGAVVGRVVATMKGINDSSRQIADIIGVIDAIAFQTNILALNAAVEAARAGAQGRGFAVVASEVRSLAGRSADAAREIKGLINASVERVAQGMALVDQAGTTMTEVVGSIRRVTDIMGEISAASSEQSAGVAQIGEAIAHMDRATQQNTALVEESAAAAGSLNGQAQRLVQAVAVFTLGAADSHSAAVRAAPLAPAQGLTGQERRSPHRARNVARPDFSAARADAQAPATRRLAAPAKAGSDTEWTSF